MKRLKVFILYTLSEPLSQIISCSESTCISENGTYTQDFLDTPRKKPEPSFIMEILDDEEESRAKMQLSPGARKFKLFQSPSPEKNIKVLRTGTANNTPDKSQCTETFESSVNDSQFNTSFTGDSSVRYVCRRIRLRSSTDGSTPKRFKLA